MKIWRNFLVLATLSLFFSCAQAQIGSHPMDMTQAIQDAKTAADHEALAKHYEEVAKSMQLKSQKYAELFEKYESNPQLYGRMGEILQNHSKSLAHLYEEAAKTNMEMAESHRSMAAEMK